jgi:CRP-like cAMP-binding protein
VPSDDRAQILQRELFFRVLTTAKPPVAVARALAQSIEDVYFEPGEVIFERGADPDAIFFLVDGEVSLEAPDEDPWTFTRGGVVGILDVNLERPRARTATARGRVHAMRLLGEDWLEILEDNFEYALGARRAVAIDLHKVVLELAPSGGFEDPPAHDGVDAVPDMNAVARLVVLRGTEGFSSASVQALASLASVAEVIDFAAGDRVFDHGDAPPAVFVVASGVVDVERGEDPIVRAAFGAGTVLGGASSFGGVLSQYRAVSRTTSTLLSIKFTDLDDVAEDHFDVTRSITKRLGVERERLMRIRSRGRASNLPPSVNEPAPILSVSTGTD